MVYSSYMNKNTAMLSESVDIVLHSLIRIGKISETRFDKAFQDVGLTKAKYHTLRSLEEHGGPLSLSEVAESLHSVRSNATQMVDRLVAEGLVERIHDPADRRVVLAQITEEGHRRYLAGREAFYAVRREILAQFSLEEREQFIALLNRIEKMWS